MQRNGSAGRYQAAELLTSSRPPAARAPLLRPVPAGVFLRTHVRYLPLCITEICNPQKAKTAHSQPDSCQIDELTPVAKASLIHCRARPQRVRGLFYLNVFLPAYIHLQIDKDRFFPPVARRVWGGRKRIS